MRVATPSQAWLLAIVPAFGISRALGNTALDYLRNQESNHNGRDFKQELLGLLTLHLVEHDARYLFD